MIIPLKEIHVWSACLTVDQYDFFYFFSILSEYEKERAQKFKFPLDQTRFVVARGILRCILSNYLELAPKDIEIIYGPYGKPRLANNVPLLHFNVSHAGEYSLYAITPTYELGIDLEYIDINLNIKGLVEEIFSPVEKEYWQTLCPVDKVQAFFKIWVCKEAYLKALGKGWLAEEGLSTNFFTLSRNPLEKDIIFPYYFETIPGYASALCVKGPFLELRHFSWDISNFQYTDHGENSPLDRSQPIKSPH